jgi:hypothetical protein
MVTPMRPLLALPLLLLFATPALAQFPPPGVYACTSGGASFGELTLLVAGDYSFKAADGTTAGGQVASAGTNVDAVSGPLKRLSLRGAFETDDTGATTFRFTSPDGLEITCR